MFIRTESFRGFLRLYPTISVIIAIHFVLWLVISLFPFGTNLLNLFVGFNYGVSEGEYWRLFTPIILHAGFAHLLFNSFSLVLFGPYLERLLGPTRFIISYIFCGFIANLATYFLESPDYLHLGASGAIFGLFGIYFYMVLNRKDLIDQANSQIIMVILAIGLVMTFTGGNINILGHLFGVISGAAIAPIILRKI